MKETNYPPDSLEMHHPDPAGDSGSVRKMAHPAVFHRRGSNTGSGSGSALSTPANPVVNNSHVPADDYPPSLLIQCQPPAGSSSPGPHHIPPHSLNLLSQPQPTQSTGAQIKKKSGFQITSVTPAQISVSTNNSIAEDTESYDDLDESHTEDLSSSEILDVSLSRANDIVGAERSSSEETLNNFHEAETPGALSPNQPSHPHGLNQAQQQGGGMVNGTVHHQHPHHPNHAQVYSLSSGPGSTPSALTSGALSCVTQNMPSNMGVPQENVSQAAPPSIVAQPVGFVAPGSVPGMHSSATGTTVSIVNPQTSSVSNVNMLSSANVPVRGGISTSASSSSGGFPLNVMSSSGGSGGGGGGGAVAAGGNLITTTNVSMIQQHQNINSTITMTTTTTAGAAVSASGGMGLSSGIQGRVGSAVLQPVSAPVTTMATAPVPSAPAPAPAPAAATTSSRFRVVKLDSSSEPFKKGRWTCTEFYDKDTPASAPSSSATDTGSLSMRQFVSDSFAGASERESTSGSSVSSTMSTLSHYTESVCSGEAGGSAVPQHAQDYASPPQGFQGILPSGLSMGVSQPHMHPQDVSHSHVNTTVAPSAPPNIHQPAPMPGHQTTIGLPAAAVHQQQLTYAQAVANQSLGSTQGLVGVQQQKLGYATLPQQPPATPQAAPVQVRPPEYTQPHQGIPQAAASQPLSNQAGAAPSGPANGACQMMGSPQQSQALLHTQPQQPSSLQATTSHVGVPSFAQQPQSHPGHLDCQQQKPQSLPNQIQNPALGTQLPTTVHQSQVSAPSVPPSNPQSDPQPQAQNTGNSGRMPSQIVPQSLPQDHSSAQALAHAAQASALYASLPTFTTTQLQDAQRLLLQHQSALLGLPKLSGGESGSGSSTGQGQEAEGNVATASALTASAGLKTVDGEEDGSSGASVVAIDNKIEQAMDLVKSHLMYAVREEVEVLKEQIKELIERNSQLEQENTLLKTLASPEQMAQFQAQVQTGSPPAPPTAATPGPPSSATLAQPTSHSSGPLA
ncbi:TSC22 domain family protein 1 isoform X1 [Micropterus salmoides]|uniref:TSC22 domain family protein 1 isoform X1 n=2 Tax=Micropterus salmoides TaxID=27706 RepID=UPI0018ED2573|nr:TSC22 domain family protein 1 isoform X1 [Micropterus salmoides]